MQLLDAFLDVGLGGILRSQELTSKVEKNTMEQRERLAYDSHTPVYYSSHEAIALQTAEVDAVMRSVPPGSDLSNMNGLNVGAGGRPIPGTIPIDAHKSLVGLDLPVVQVRAEEVYLKDISICRQYLRT